MLLKVGGVESFADYLGRIAADDGVRRHVLQDDAAGGRDAALADLHIGHDDRPVADPHVVVNEYAMRICPGGIPYCAANHVEARIVAVACLGKPDSADMKVYCPMGKKTFDDDETTEEAPS